MTYTEAWNNINKRMGELMEFRKEKQIPLYSKEEVEADIKCFYALKSMEEKE